MSENAQDLKEAINRTISKVLAPLGFKGPFECSNHPSAFALVYVNGNFGVSIEADLRDRILSSLIYDASETFSFGYRDMKGEIRKRYLIETLTTLKLLSPKSEQEIKTRQNQRPYFWKNLEPLCEEEARLLKQWIPHLMPLQESLFGITKIDGHPAYYF